MWEVSAIVNAVITHSTSVCVKSNVTVSLSCGVNSVAKASAKGVVSADVCVVAKASATACGIAGLSWLGNDSAKDSAKAPAKDSAKAPAKDSAKAPAKDSAKDSAKAPAKDSAEGNVSAS